MADNVAITAGAGTTVAADEVGGAKYQRVKISLGDDGTAVDWDAGAGVVGTDTARITLASDDPAVTSVQIMDDWDESDRAKVNLIVGQAGIAAGAGASGDTVPRVTLASDSPGVVPWAAEYEFVDQNATAQVIGASGAVGDYISHLVVTPMTTSPGSIILLDQATSYTVFVGGASSVSNLVPFTIPLGMVCTGTSWKVSTGANIKCLAVGNFTW